MYPRITKYLQVFYLLDKVLPLLIHSVPFYLSNYFGLKFTLANVGAGMSAFLQLPFAGHFFHSLIFSFLTSLLAFFSPEDNTYLVPSF